MVDDSERWPEAFGEKLKDIMNKEKCSECKKKRELTLWGTCWKCHLSSVSLQTFIEVRKPKGKP